MNKRFITWLVIMGIIVGTGTFITIKEKEKAAKDNVNIDKFNENIEEYSNKENKIETLSSNEFKNEKEFEENIIKLHPISSITDSMKDKKVVIQGEIVELVEHKNGHLFLTVKDSSGSILVPIFKDKNIDMNKIKVNNKSKLQYQIELVLNYDLKTNYYNEYISSKCISNNSSGVL